jgi:hypothetical protein
MDSVVSPRSVYYSGGPYIIGTNANVDPHDRRIDEHTPYVFVFDSGGRFVYTIGARRPVVAPTGAQVTTAFAGRVTVTWVGTGANAMRYQLQRAQASSPFVAVGPALLPGATTAVDTTAVRGITYRYRIDAVGPAGDSTFSNEVTVVPQADIGPITPSSTGLLYRDTFDRADGPPGTNWVAESGTWQVIGNRLQVNIR